MDKQQMIGKEVKIQRFERRYVKEIMKIWLDANVTAHAFIEPSYWENAYDSVASVLPTADIFMYCEEDLIKGFIGVTDDRYIAGLFVKGGCQSQGIGKQLLNYCKNLYPCLELDVFVENERAVKFYLNRGFEIKNTGINLEFGHQEHHMVWKKKM